MIRGIREDIRAMLARDPAARHSLEVLLCYPGMHAIWAHRLSHWLWQHGLRLLARFLAHIVRRHTGVEIHPGARIGRITLWGGDRGELSAPRPYPGGKGSEDRGGGQLCARTCRRGRSCSPATPG